VEEMRDKEKLIKDFLIEKLNPDLIYIFGSFAKGELRDDSDIDIAFLSSKEFDEYEIFLLGQKLADCLKREVDLIDLKKASTVFKAQIIDGKLIYANTLKQKMDFQLKVMQEYTQLNQDRREVLKNYKLRGGDYDS
jgi:predicted nucleotidyltransferase